MFKRCLFLFLLISFSCMEIYASDDLEISNEYFSFTMPKKAKGTYSVEKEDNGIYIIEKISKDTDRGGFAFALKIYKDSHEYADMEDAKKIGELIVKSGEVYDVVLIHPREIYYGDGKKIERNYKRLYNFAPMVDIKGVGENKYIKI